MRQRAFKLHRIAIIRNKIMYFFSFQIRNGPDSTFHSSGHRGLPIRPPPRARVPRHGDAPRRRRRLPRDVTRAPAQAPAGHLAGHGTARDGTVNAATSEVKTLQSIWCHKSPTTG